MRYLDGRELAGYIKQRQAKEVRRLKHAGFAPVLAIICDNPQPTNQLYMSLKKKYGAEIGVKVIDFNVEPSELANTIRSVNKDETINGLIVQLPMTTGVDTDALLDAINPDKDVDGLGEKAKFDPATPLAILWLLAGYGIELADKKIAIVGQGRLVGKPLAAMLRNSGIEPATFDVGSKNLNSNLKKMDLIVTAVGQPGLITNHAIASGSVVIDAGTASESGILKGDVADEVYECEDITITPKKGGVGPLTVSALFDNTLRAARARVGRI